MGQKSDLAGGWGGGGVEGQGGTDVPNMLFMKGVGLSLSLPPLPPPHHLEFTLRSSKFKYNASTTNYLLFFCGAFPPTLSPKIKSRLFEKKGFSQRILFLYGTPFVHFKGTHTHKHVCMQNI